MKRRLLTRLALPLLAATALSIVTSRYWPLDGFFVNLAAGFVGSLVTIFYVDLILKQHESDRWRATDLRIASLLRRVATRAITGIRTSLGYGTDIFDQHAFASGNVATMEAEVARVAIAILVPNASAKIGILDQSGWKTFMSNLRASGAECDVLLDRFGHHLQPETVATLLDLKSAIESAQTYWRTFPDLAGVAPELLSHSKPRIQDLQKAWNEITAKSTREALQLAVT